MIVPLDENGFRNAKPDFAGRQNTAHLGRTDAEHVGAERAAGWRMAVTANAEHAWRQVPALRQHDVADPLLVIEVADVLIDDPLPGQFLDGARLLRIGRNIMVGNHHDPVPVPDMAAEALQHRLHPARPAGIMDHRKIDFADHHIANSHGWLSGGARNQFSCKSFH